MSDSGPDQRVLQVVAVIAVAAAIVGYLTGTRTTRSVGGYEEGQAISGEVAFSPTYGSIREDRYGDRNQAQIAALATLAEQDRSPREPADPEAKALALQEWLSLRAFDGAPPTVPHRVEARDIPSCLGCHAEGLAVGAHEARVMTHNRYDNCLQCHIQATGRSVADLPPQVPSENSFAGVAPIVDADRPYPGGPPMTPHPTFMRERCEGCHGALSGGMHTSHPDRQNCQQCHTLGAVLDQRPVTLTSAF